MPLRPFVFFDWGDTVMVDDPASMIPMVEWPQVRAVDGIDSVLARLKSAGSGCILATSASISDEAQIRAALARASLDAYFARIYCFKNTGLPKGTDFYQHILADLGIPASQAMMIGDHFEKDVLAANAAGIYAVWFNPRDTETHEALLHTTVHSMPALLEFLSA